MSLQAPYTPNSSITLQETHITQLAEHSIRAPARVIFRLLPQPLLVIEIDDLPGNCLERDNFPISLESGVRLNAVLGSWKLGRTISGDLVPIPQPQVAFDLHQMLHHVEFGVLNFPLFYGNQDRWSEHNATVNRIGVTKLTASPWSIELNSVDNLSEQIRALRSAGGYAITHVGRIDHIAGKRFAAEDLVVLLVGLRAFLSYVRGAACGFPLVRGYGLRGKLLWLRWGSGHVEPHATKRSVMPLLGGDMLADLFPGFWRMFTHNESWQETILNVIDWYLNSNTNPFHVGIVLTQTALERLSSHILGRNLVRSTVTGILIRDALVHLDIDPTVRADCEDLEAFRVSYGLEDGPHALVEIRNDLVHPRRKYGRISAATQIEAWNLGQYFIELMLLKLFGYDGSYRNRLKGNVEGMPNAKETLA